jgi:hypothetical protein
MGKDYYQAAQSFSSAIAPIPGRVTTMPSTV